jgi:hypothetical protein
MRNETKLFMHRSGNSASRRTASENDIETLAVRSYRQIAEILVERKSAELTAAHVAHICRVAEMKIVRGFLADPEIRGLLATRGGTAK